MGILDEIKKESIDKGISKGLQVEEDIKAEINKLFYLDPVPELENAFINQMFTRGQDTKERVGLHASAIIKGDSFCLRQQVLSLLFKQDQGEQTDIGLKRIFMAGDYIHEKYQRLFLRGGLCRSEDLDFTRFLKDYELSYTPDAIIRFRNLFGGDKVVVEIKSVNSFQFDRMIYHPSGKLQCLFYMRLERIKHGFVLAENKNTQEIKIFYYNYPGPDKEYKFITDEFVERLRNVRDFKQNFIDYGKMVSRHPKCTKCDCKMAASCPLRDACWGVGKGRVKLYG